MNNFKHIVKTLVILIVTAVILPGMALAGDLEPKSEVVASPTPRFTDNSNMKGSSLRLALFVAQQEPSGDLTP